MGVGQQLGDGQVMGAAGQAVAALLAGRSIDLFKPMAGLADQAIALFGKALHAMAHRQVAEPQQLGDRQLLRAGQAGPALAAGLRSKPLLLLLVESLEGPLLQLR